VSSTWVLRCPMWASFVGLWEVEMETNAAGSVATWPWRGHRNIPVQPTVDGERVDISYTSS
jgi:hypothetical protein